MVYMYSPENMNVMNRKQKVLFGGKQPRRKERYVDKPELLCLTKNCGQNFLRQGRGGRGEEGKHMFPIS